MRIIHKACLHYTLITPGRRLDRHVAQASALRVRVINETRSPIPLVRFQGLGGSTII